MFFLKAKYYIIFLLIYADGIIITGKYPFHSSFPQTIQLFLLPFRLGFLHYYLGMEVQRDANEMYLKQSKYTDDLLNKFRMDNKRSNIVQTSHKNITILDSHKISSGINNKIEFDKDYELTRK